MPRPLFILVILLLTAPLAYSQNIKFSADTIPGQPVRVWTSDDSAEVHEGNTVDDEDESLLKSTGPWLFTSGDDLRYSAPGWDDSNWIVIDDSTSRDSVREKTICWYRMHFRIDSSLMNVPLALLFLQAGSAAEVYLDGKLLKAFGKVGKSKETEHAEFSIFPSPFAFTLSPKADHVFAVRFSGFHRSLAIASGFGVDGSFDFRVRPLNEEIERVADPSRFFPIVFFGAIFITLGAMHMIMFFFLREKKSNFSYSIYCFVISLIIFYIYYILTSTDFDSVTRLGKLALYMVSVVVVPLVSMMHRIFYGRRLKIFWAITALFAVSLAFFFMENYQLAAVTVFVLFVISTIEIIRVILKAVYRRKDGARIFLLVFLLAPVAGIISSNLPDTLTIAGMQINNNTGLVVFASFILGLPLAMALYLSGDFAKMNNRLKEQLVEITGLSEKTLRQEKEKKQFLENQNIELEKMVTVRTQEVVMQKNIIEVKNKEILDNLTYAKRIQAAILPDARLISKAMPQSFILFLPKDIVSGDFYGFAEKSGRIVLAAADCTGHGVTGAFMSMIGSALLNQILNERGLLEPAAILGALSEGIVGSLRQKEYDANDGMDISLCTFDFRNHVVDYAGANRPLWMIRDGELMVFKPDKRPIGGMQVMQSQKFTNHEIPLLKGDTLYLFTDGFADQFGGTKGKKMFSKNFAELLISIQHLPMQEQGTFLENHFRQWQGAHDQVDDVLVMGIRVSEEGGNSRFIE